jgi:hypothetical protein
MRCPSGIAVNCCRKLVSGRPAVPGHIALVLAEFFGTVNASDAYDYGYGRVREFLTHPHEKDSVDWVITNPPLRHSEQFVIRALDVAREGVAILARTTFIESVGRYRNLFDPVPPSRFAQFTERVPMVRGRLDRKASTATGYAWLVWEKDRVSTGPRLMWIPPCRKQLEREGDYSASTL